MKTLSKKVYDQLVELSNRAELHLSVAIRIDTNCENLPDYFKDKSAPYYVGMAAGNYAAMETILNSNNAYAGYTEGRIPDTKYYSFRMKLSSNQLHCHQHEYVTERALEKLAS